MSNMGIHFDCLGYVSAKVLFLKIWDSIRPIMKPVIPIVVPTITLVVPGKMSSNPPARIQRRLMASANDRKGPAVPHDSIRIPAKAVPMTHMVSFKLPIKSMELSSANEKGRMCAAMLNIMEYVHTFQKLVFATIAATYAAGAMGGLTSQQMAA